MDKREKRYFRKQKFLGLILILLGFISVILTDGDLTAAIIVVPMGTHVFLTKEHVMWDDEYPEYPDIECAEDEEL